MFGIGGEPSVGASEERLPYRLRDDFLSPAERSFHTVLVAAANSRFVVCPKVNLADVFFVAKPNENKGARGRIAQKHVDFLLCDPGTMQPRLGVELDDSSHARADRQERDAFVDSVFRDAGLRLVHVPVRAAYNVTEIVQLLGAEPLGVAAAPAVEPTAVAPSSSAPLCPKCGVPMVLRTSGRGDTRGSQFYGCVNYPRCRETVPLG
jgi:hypothetical protein